MFYPHTPRNDSECIYHRGIWRLGVYALVPLFSCPLVPNPCVSDTLSKSTSEESRASNTPKLKGQRLIRKPPPASLSLSPAIAPTASFLSGSSEGCTPESVLFSGPWRLSSSTDFRRFYPPAFLWLVFLTFRTAVKLPQTVIRRIFLTKPYKFLPLILLQGKRPNLVWRFLGCHWQCEWFCTCLFCVRSTCVR